MRSRRLVLSGGAVEIDVERPQPTGWSRDRAVGQRADASCDECVDLRKGVDDGIGPVGACQRPISE